MQLTVEERKKWNASIVGCLKKFISICEKHQLTYFCIGGTAIGAVRHNGLIPWDDDIDVGMPRKDYDRFVEVCKTEDLGHYEFMSAQTEGALYAFGKLSDKATTIIEHKHAPVIYGLYIDIFPIDGTAPTKDEAVQMMRTYRRWMNKVDAAMAKVSLSQYLSLLFKPKDWGRMAWLTAAVVLGRERIRKFIMKKLDAISRQYDYDTAKNLVNYNGCYWEREIFPREWVGAPVEHDFEGFRVKLMQHTDEYLRNVYGDYMQLPPPEKRVCQHDHYFHYLDGRLTMAEIEAKIATTIDK